MTPLSIARSLSICAVATASRGHKVWRQPASRRRGGGRPSRPPLSPGVVWCSGWGGGAVKSSGTPLLHFLLRRRRAFGPLKKYNIYILSFIPFLGGLKLIYNWCRLSSSHPELETRIVNAIFYRLFVPKYVKIQFIKPRN